MPAYGASKAGLNSMTQSLAHALAPHGVFVGGVAPGFVETDMSRDRLQGSVGDQIKAQSPMNRVASPREVAEAVLLMAQSNIWMTGGIFDVNGASYFRV
jgi:NAD(P)-dependent dehydrogenase (short-subunit alcohol dehydrogenase family)